MTPATESEQAAAAWQGLGWTLAYLHQPCFHISIFLPLYSTFPAKKPKPKSQAQSLLIREEIKAIHLIKLNMILPLQS